jgi:hypothetical protein
MYRSTTKSKETLMIQRLRLVTLIACISIPTIALGDYASTVLEDAPFAYFRFEEPAGANELADSSGNGNVGYEVNDVIFGGAGIVGNAGEFIGSSSIVTDLNFDPSIDGLEKWTVETWFYTTGVEEIDDPDNPGEFIEVVKDQQVYLAQKDGDGLGRSNVLISAQRQPGSFIGGGTTNAIDPAEDPVAAETWYHFVMSVDNAEDELYFYVNGQPSELNPQFPGANGVESASGDWVIGSHKNQGVQFFEGLLDEIAFYDFLLSEERILAHYEAATSAGIPGDYDGDGQLTATDIDALSTAVRDGKSDGEFDLDGNGTVDPADRLFWVNELKVTYVGDSNLDLEFNSGDFVTVFTAGEYEDNVEGNSTWATGDWNGDGDFSSSDFVLAFQQEGYEKGPRAGANTVPEPGSTLMFCMCLALLSRGWRKLVSN